MTSRLCRTGRMLLATGLVLGSLLAAPSGALAQALEWRDCGDGFQCATLAVPRDHSEPGGPTLDLAVARLPARDPANRIGSLFMNFGGPGDAGAETLRGIPPEAFASVADRFDLVSWDPRGTGSSSGAIDCAVNQETQGLNSQPFPKPLDPASEAAFVERTRAYVARCVERSDPGILPYIATTNTVRDLDLLRAAVGDSKLTYLGYSGGTFIGAQYATLFPGGARALVLDGAVDHESYVNRPIEDFREQTAAAERAFGRFLMACAAQANACGFGGEDPWTAFDELAARLDGEPLPVPGAPDRPVDGDDARWAAILSTYAKQLWPIMAEALAQAQAGDGTGLRLLADAFYGRREDGSYDPFNDRYMAITSLDLAWPGDAVQTYLDTGRHSFRMHDRFWANDYGTLGFGLWPVEAVGAYRGPVDNPADAATALVVGTTYDSATPYVWARSLAADLGNARLLTMSGDGHTAFPGSSACVDAAVERYLEALELPAEGTVCRQEVPFAAAAERGALTLETRLPPLVALEAR